MRYFSSTMLLALVLSIASSTIAQSEPGLGTLVVRARTVKGANKAVIPLARKRFYVFPGGLRENQGLIDRLRAAEASSRDCFYAKLQASPCFVAWLKKENCESPFCRAVKREEIEGVKEFEAAYAKGLTAYRNKPDIALSWITTNLPSNLATGYYRQQKNFVNGIVGADKPVQTMLSTSGAEATFSDLKVEGKTSKYLVANIVPVEIDGKSYIWACEVDVKPVVPSPLVLALPIPSTNKKCVLIEKVLPVCTVEACERK